MGPDLARSNPFLILEAELMEFVVVTASEESLHLRNNLETPTLTVVMRHIVKFIVLPSDVECADPSIIMPNQDLVIHVIQR